VRGEEPGVKAPEAPVNVRIRRKNGHITPVDLVYEGVFVSDQKPGWKHRWVSVHQYADMVPGDAVEADEIPEHTELIVRLPG